MYISLFRSTVASVCTVSLSDYQHKSLNTEFDHYITTSNASGLQPRHCPQKSILEGGLKWNNALFRYYILFSIIVSIYATRASLDQNSKSFFSLPLHFREQVCKISLLILLMMWSSYFTRTHLHMGRILCVLVNQNRLLTSIKF